jgi:hypothetical protein
MDPESQNTELVISNQQGLNGKSRNCVPEALYSFFYFLPILVNEVLVIFRNHGEPFQDKIFLKRVSVSRDLTFPHFARDLSRGHDHFKCFEIVDASLHVTLT